VKGERTVKRYASFVLRCWRLESDELRIDVEHVQSGARTRVRSLAAAVAWMDGRRDAPVDLPAAGSAALAPAGDSGGGA
jgi:hypothetical protein